MAQNTTQNRLRHVGSVIVIVDFTIKSPIESLIFICGILIVSSHRFIVVYYGLSLIVVHDGLRIQKISDARTRGILRITKISDEYVIKKR